jgi:dsDNA-specific endonuclease/ATPase MutS2
LRVLEREIASEILKILAALTDEVKGARDSLLIGLDTLSELDLVSAKAELARALSASMSSTGSTPSIILDCRIQVLSGVRVSPRTPQTNNERSSLPAAVSAE